jgi:hypothetical protein
MVAPAPQLHRDERLAALARREVQFVVIGGMAAQLHGVSRSARDLEICPAWRLENFRRLVTALETVEARLKPDLEVRPSVELLRETPVTRWRTPPGDLDVHLACSGKYGVPVGFSELAPRALELVVAGAVVLVAPLEDLISAMEYTNRDLEDDREALRQLRALRTSGGSRAETVAQPVSAEPPRRSSIR